MTPAASMSIKLFSSPVITKIITNLNRTGKQTMIIQSSSVSGADIGGPYTSAYLFMFTLAAVGLSVCDSDTRFPRVDMQLVPRTQRSVAQSGTDNHTSTPSA